MNSPIAIATLQACVLNAVSNVLAQLINSWRAGTAYNPNVLELCQFVLFSALSCPPNFQWQSWLEAQFPAYADRLSHLEKEALVDGLATGSSTAIQTKQARRIESKVMSNNSPDSAMQNKPNQLNVKNTVIKFLLDQTLGSAANTLLFIIGMGLIRAHKFSSLQHDVVEQFWPMLFAAQKFWPFVSIVNFTIVPLEHRMLLGNAAGLVWGVYLSLVSGGAKAES